MWYGWSLHRMNSLITYLYAMLKATLPHHTLSCPSFKHNSKFSPRPVKYSGVYNALIKKSPGEDSFHLRVYTPQCYSYITFTQCWFNFYRWQNSLTKKAVPLHKHGDTSTQGCGFGFKCVISIIMVIQQKKECYVNSSIVNILKIIFSLFHRYQIISDRQLLYLYLY